MKNLWVFVFFSCGCLDMGSRVFYYISLFGDVAGIETSRQQTMAKNFLPNMDNSYESLKPNLVASTSKLNAKPCGFFPEIRSFGASSSKEDTNNMTDFGCVFQAYFRRSIVASLMPCCLRTETKNCYRYL